MTVDLDLIIKGEHAADVRELLEVSDGFWGFCQQSRGFDISVVAGFLKSAGAG